VRGSVTGEVTAKQRVEVGPQGRLDGVVRTPRLRIDEGAKVTARLEMGEPANPSAAAPPRR
jgi:cytoskeletal protein CcmA (bactofilin family)